MFHHKKTKYKFLRQYFLPILAIVFLLGVVVFWCIIFLKTSISNNQVVFQKNHKEVKLLGKDFDERLNQVLEEFSCEAKNEKLVKGFVKKINKDYIIIEDQRQEFKVYLKPETIFLRVYKEEESVFEIGLSSLQVRDDVVASVFENDKGNKFSLLVKQIINN